jgi:predicted Zn-dependent peptidase
MLRLLATAAAFAFAAPALAQTAAPAPVSELVKRVDIPFETFTLANGLRVVVHTDRKAPVVSLHTWYDVGSGDEPNGKTGFAHLFEHLMFAGSEHVANYDLPLENAGATNNGSTNVDRTNYFVDMPKGTLDLALYLEADRMGALLPAISQAKLDNQRSVVQNEKRQGDNQPYGLSFYAIFENVYPAGHPYHHSTIGSMADLDKASLDDVRSWFRGHYAPNNAVIAIAGDISAEEARAKVSKYFGSIPRGPQVGKRMEQVPRLAQVKRLTLHDRVPNARLTYAWPMPADREQENSDLNVALAVLADGGASRLYNALVRDQKIALGVSGGVFDGRIASTGLLSIDVKQGVDPATVERAVDAVIAKFRAEGPTPDEVKRVATKTVSGTIRGLERVGSFGGKASTLAEGLLYEGDPAFYKTELLRYANATPAAVKAAAVKWMGPSFRLTVVPGERGPTELAYVGESGVAAPPKADPLPPVDATKLPAVGRVDTLTFPAIERGTLSNGIKLVFARRATIPVVNIVASFDAGTAADPPSARGTQGLMVALMDEGTARRTGPEIVTEAERLGAAISIDAGADTTRATLSALTPNLAASLDLFADVVRNPAFAPAEVERVRTIQLASIQQELANPGGIAGRVLTPAIYGADHPYGGAGLGDPGVVAKLTRDDMIAFHRRWIRPDKLTLFVVGDTTLAHITPALERAFGDWRADDSVVAGTKPFPPAVPRSPAKIVLVDRPNSPQSFIAAGQPLALTGRDDLVALNAANEALGGSFTSRLNTDLRETKGWAYGAGSAARAVQRQMAFSVRAPVQQDRTGDSIKAIIDDVGGFTGAQPITQAELDRSVNLTVLSLPGAFETSGALVGALEQLSVLGRPDDYYVKLPARYRALTPAAATAAAKSAIDVGSLQWVVVGDRAKVEPQLKAVGLPLEVRAAK